jgi:hypothetical protein
MTFMTTSIIFAGFAVPWYWDFNKTDTLICVAVAVAVWGTGEIELRLKTIQIRLAGMEDKLDRLAGNEPEDNLLLELSDW